MKIKGDDEGEHGGFQVHREEVHLPSEPHDRHRHPFSYNSVELGQQQTERRVRARKMRLPFPGNRGKGLI